MAQLKNRPSYEGQFVALEEVLQILREQEKVEVLIETTLQYLDTGFDFDLVWIGLTDPVKPGLIGQGGFAPTQDTALLKQQFRLSPGDLLDQVLVQQRPAGVPDLREETRAGEWREAAQKFNIQGTIIFPIRYKAHCFGLALMGSHLWGGSPRSDESARLSMILRALGAALYQIEENTQRQQVKRPDQPLLALLANLDALSTLTQRLEVVVQQTQQFIDPTRTSVYWFEPERRYFWRRVTQQSKGNRSRESPQSTLEIAAQDIRGFYQALSTGQMIAVSEAQGTVKADVPSRLMQQMKARSLLAVPILSQKELLGFLAVESHQPRIWEEAEKNYIRGAAQLLTLIAPLEKLEKTIQQTQLDQALMSGLTHSICRDHDWNETLRQSADQLCQRLQVIRLLILLPNPETGMFEAYYQKGPRQRLLQSPLNRLSDVDWQMLERTTEVIAIENLSEDLRLLAWRETLLGLGVRSLLVCSTSTGRPQTGFLVIAHEASRTWSTQERQIVQGVSQQLGLILHQWQLQQQVDQQQQIHKTMQQGLITLQQAHSLERLEQVTLQQITQLLQAPLVALISWSPGQRQGWIITPPATNQEFAIRTETAVAVDTDPLIQSALQKWEQTAEAKHAGFVQLSVDQLSPETRLWLSGSKIGQVGVMALQTLPEHLSSGVVLIADHPERRWSDLQLGGFATLVNQLAWAHRFLQVTTTLQHSRQNLECLNWYKQRHIEEIYRSISQGSKQLNELITQAATSVELDGAGSPSRDTSLLEHYQPVLGQFRGTLTSMLTLMQNEEWQLHMKRETIVLATLLKRVLERVDPWIRQRQLWSQVHSRANVTLDCDIGKIELILYELLYTACGRSPTGGRIDIWCQPLDQHWLELSITDTGLLEPQLLLDLQQGDSLDLLAASTLNYPPGLHLKIAQTLMQQLGGRMEFSQLEDGRVLSRLTLPLVVAAPGRYSGCHVS